MSQNIRHHLLLQKLSKPSLSSPCSSPSLPFGASRRGRANQALLIFVGLVLLTLAMGLTRLFKGSSEAPLAEPSQSLNLCSTTNMDPEASSARPGHSEGLPLTADKRLGLWPKVREALKVERVHHSGDAGREERDLIRKGYRRVRETLEALRRQGLDGDYLYAAAEEQLLAAYGPEVLKLLDDYRRLEQELAGEDPDAMNAEERFEYRHNARRTAFGEEMAHMLFFDEETRERYRLEERALRDDPDLNEEIKQERISLLRKKLRVDLAPQGTTLRFADERLQVLEEALIARYGESVETMTPEERDQAVWDLYSEELPPDIMEKVKQLRRSWAQRSYGE